MMKLCILILLFVCFCCVCGYAQAPVITPKAGPIVIRLDSTGNYNVQLSDIATVKGKYNAVSVSPVDFDCDDLGAQVVTVSAGYYTGYDPAAVLNYPYGIVCDESGNIYVADASNNQIKKITPAGVISVFAGSGMLGSADGPGSSASFARPWGLAIDDKGNIYVADAGNNKIREITPAGKVSTIAGNGAKGADDGVGQAATFNNPADVAVDASGDIYVVDSDNNLIRKISPDGAVSTFAGNGQLSSADGAGANAGFYNPHGITIDRAGIIYIADGNNRIRRISPGAVVTTYAGSGSDNKDGTGLNASFYFPLGIAVDALGNLYIADTGNNEIRKITAGAIVTTFAGSGLIGSADGKGKNAAFNAPTRIATDQAGNLYVTEAPGNKIRKITPNGVVTTLSLLGANGIGSESTNLPINVTVLTQPAITSKFSNTVINAYPGCIPVIPDYTATATATDNCTAEKIRFTQAPLPGTPLVARTTQKVTITAADETGGTDSASFNITVAAFDGPIVSFAANPIVFGGTGIQLDPQVNSDITGYSWSPATGLSDPIIKNPVASPSSNITYTLTVTSEGGCTGSAQVTVSVEQVVIPNAFTPNGDGINDFWNIGHLEEYRNCTVDVFNRGGQLVFHSIGYSKPWPGTYNGSVLPSGTYYYVIDLKNGQKKLSGEVTLIK